MAVDNAQHNFSFSYDTEIRDDEGGTWDTIPFKTIIFHSLRVPHRHNFTSEISILKNILLIMCDQPKQTACFGCAVHIQIILPTCISFQFHWLFKQRSNTLLLLRCNVKATKEFWQMKKQELFRIAGDSVMLVFVWRALQFLNWTVHSGLKRAQYKHGA